MTLSGETISEVIILALVYYGFIRHLQATRGGGLLAGFMFLVVVAVLLFGLAISHFHIPHIRFIADAAMPSLAFALLVIFQPELRFAISRIGSTRVVRLLERFLGGTSPKHNERLVDAIIVACQRMSKKKTGALIAVQNKEGIEGFNLSGTLVNAEVSAPLIETIFQKGSPLHDGALLIINGRAMWAGCHLPLSEAGSARREYGTRHCAALGMSEESDALVIVVSEETGRISVAKEGTLHVISIGDLRLWISSSIEAQLKVRRVTHSGSDSTQSMTTSQINISTSGLDTQTIKRQDTTPEEISSP